MKIKLTKKKIVAFFIPISIILFSFYNYEYRPAATFNTITEISKDISSFKRDSLILNGKTYYYLDNEKKNAPVAIYLHGFTDRKEAWFPYMAINCKKYLFINDNKYRIILPDLPGHGENDRDTSINYTFEYYSDFLNQFKEALEIEKFHLLGVSMGGAIAGKYSYSYQESLLSLIMMSNAGINNNSTPSKMELLMKDMTLEEKRNNIPIIPKNDSAIYIDLLKEYLVYNDRMVPDKMFKEFAQHIIEDRDFYIKILEDFLVTETGKFKDPLDPHLKEITIPTLIIWGKEDAILHYSSVEVIKEMMPSEPETLIIPKCGHGAYVDYPLKVKKTIKAFLKKNTTTE